MQDTDRQTDEGKYIEIFAFKREHIKSTIYFLKVILLILNSMKLLSGISGIELTLEILWLVVI